MTDVTRNNIYRYRNFVIGENSTVIGCVGLEGTGVSDDG